MSAEEKNDPRPQRRIRSRDGSMGFVTRGPAVGDMKLNVTSGKIDPAKVAQAIERDAAKDILPDARPSTIEHASDDLVRARAQRLLEKRRGLMMALAHR